MGPLSTPHPLWLISLHSTSSLRAGQPPQPQGVSTAPDPGDSDDEEGEVKKYSGEIEIPNLSDENDLEDIDVSSGSGHA